MTEINICLPGQRLCLSDNKHISGKGTYERQGYIYSSLAGILDIVIKDNIKVIEVHAGGEEAIVPAQGDIVTAKVYKITLQQCHCQIKCIGDIVLRRPLKAILRKEDIYAHHRSKVEVYKSFRPGDIILARVLPITQANNYNLSTAENELGVTMAHSVYGYPMVPISWSEMQCCRTYVKELRKVAKIAPEQVDQN